MGLLAEFRLLGKMVKPKRVTTQIAATVSGPPPPPVRMTNSTVFYTEVNYAGGTWS